MTARPSLQTARLTLRAPAPADWPAYHDFMMGDRARFFASSGDAGTAWRAFASELGHWQIYGIGMWAVTLTGNDAPVGIVGPFHPPHWPEKEIGWMLFDAGLEGQGIAFEAARACVDHAFDVLGWATAVSYIDPNNARSIALAEKLGAVRDDAARATKPGELVYRHPAPQVAA